MDLIKMMNTLAETLYFHQSLPQRYMYLNP